MARVWEGGGEEGTPGRHGTWMGRLRASKQADRQVWGGRAPRGSSLSRLPRREHEQEEGSRPQSAGCGLWPPPRPPPRAAARLRACGFAAASPMLERRPGVKKVSVCSTWVGSVLAVSFSVAAGFPVYRGSIALHIPEAGGSCGAVLAVCRAQGSESRAHARSHSSHCLRRATWSTSSQIF